LYENAFRFLVPRTPHSNHRFARSVEKSIDLLSKRRFSLLSSLEFRNRPDTVHIRKAVEVRHNFTFLRVGNNPLIGVHVGDLKAARRAVETQIIEADCRAWQSHVCSCFTGGDSGLSQGTAFGMDQISKSVSLALQYNPTAPSFRRDPPPTQFAFIWSSGRTSILFRCYGA
jgi:hypothetical protein